ncbi:hypothetical protein LEMLEM_LOCUS9844, partial [Lemmus lemmus]
MAFISSCAQWRTKAGIQSQSSKLRTSVLVTGELIRKKSSSGSQNRVSLGWGGAQWWNVCLEFARPQVCSLTTQTEEK